MRPELPLFGLFAASLAAKPLLPAWRSSHDVLASPSGTHLLGTNAIGQDIALGLLHATPNTLLVALAAAALATGLALIAAGLALTSPPTACGAILRLIDALQVLPAMLILLFVAAFVQPGLAGLILLLGMTSWHEDVRLALTLLRREAKRENVSFARRMGASWLYCFRRHILPAFRPALAALYVQNIRQVTLRGAGLAFLGLTDPRLPTWGGMMQDAMNYLYTPAWSWLLLPPALTLTLFLLAMLALTETAPTEATS